MSFLTLRTIPKAATSSWTTVRTLATIAPDFAIPQNDGRQRPQSNVEISSDHGLWAFFRKDKEEKALTLEPAHRSNDFSGRFWHASELRRKNFKDLHTLWYVCLRERNLLATQRAEFRRMGISMAGTTNLMEKDKRVRKTMKHIKLVLNERRLAFDQARELWQKSQANAKPTTPEVASVSELEAIS